VSDLDHLDSAELLARYRAGEDRAASAIYGRYVERLTALARTRLSRRLRSRTDPEDIVLSAWRSFFVAARNGRIDVAGSGGLWPLLVTLTIRKLYRNVKQHTAAKRSVDMEQRLDGDAACDVARLIGEPGPEAAAALTDELENILCSLRPFERRVLELALQGESVHGIAAATGRAERTVRRAYTRVRDLIVLRLQQNPVEAVPSPRKHRRKHPRPLPSAGQADAPESLRSSHRDPRAEHGTGHSADTASLSYADFLLRRQIGAGGMGKVYRALDRRHGREVAVKFLRKSFHEHPHAVERFVREARIVARLRHPGIVGIHGLGRTPHGGYFIAMDLMQGDLTHLLGRGIVAVENAARWTIEACAAIEHAHAHGIVHCDLKPSNLLIGDDGRIRVSDFGLARVLADSPRIRAEIGGTAPFMSPEQISGEWGAVSFRTDVYGLGAVLYCLLTGQPPSPGSRLADVLSMVLSPRPATPIHALRKDVPPAIESICSRCLAKNPGDRFASAGEVADELRKCGDFEATACSRIGE
jgi:hypothetical protein